ncbi:MAG: ABC transporter permease [Verrucomicrobiae bacterium]|nr:ABC transporter permease [Verrucomicrobiae bacterium]
MKPRSENPTCRAWLRLRRNPAAMAGLCFGAIMVLAVLLGPPVLEWIHGDTYDKTSAAQYLPPSLRHPFGTDIHGRDLLTRVLYGGRISLAVGLVGATVSMTIGVLYGMIAGYFGGKIDEMMMRLVDILYSLPRIVFVMILIASLTGYIKVVLQQWGMLDFLGLASILLLFVGLGIVEWLTMARIVRGQVLALREKQFVLAAQSLGAGPLRIIFRHLLPNLTGIVVTYMTLTVPVVILEESFLSFLGLGIQAPLSSWGSLISDGAAVINPVRVYWWLVLFPGAVMALSLMSLNFLGDGLRDAFDPKNRRS